MHLNKSALVPDYSTNDMDIERLASNKPCSSGNDKLCRPAVCS